MVSIKRIGGISALLVLLLFVFPCFGQEEFLKRDGSTPLTSDWNIGDNGKILADEISARNGAGLKLFAADGTGVIVEDGGSLAFGDIAEGWGDYYALTIGRGRFTDGIAITTKAGIEETFYGVVNDFGTMHLNSNVKLSANPAIGNYLEKLSVKDSLRLEGDPAINYFPASDKNVELIKVHLSDKTARFFWNDAEDVFEMDSSLVLPAGSLVIGDVALSKSGSCLMAPDFHAKGAGGGLSGYLKIAYGTTPTSHSQPDRSIIWVDNDENLMFERSDGVDYKVKLASTGSMVMGGNVTPTIITTEDTFVDLNLAGLAVPASDNELWTLTDDTSGEMRYDGTVLVRLHFTGLIAAYSAGGTQRFNFRLLKNGLPLPSPDDVDIPIEIRVNIHSSSLLWSIMANPGDLFRLQVENADGVSDITIDTLKVSIQ